MPNKYDQVHLYLEKDLVNKVKKEVGKKFESITAFYKFLLEKYFLDKEEKRTRIDVTPIADRLVKYGKGDIEKFANSLLEKYLPNEDTFVIALRVPKELIGKEEELELFLDQKQQTIVKSLCPKDQ